MITDDEKVILRNLPSKFKYIARHGIFSNELIIFDSKPYLECDFFMSHGYSMHFNQYKHIFNTIEIGKCYEIKELLGE